MPFMAASLITQIRIISTSMVIRVSTNEPMNSAAINSIGIQSHLFNPSR